jgi:hypothetical protein
MDTRDNKNIKIKIHCSYEQLKSMFYGCDTSMYELIEGKQYHTEKDAIVILDRRDIEHFEKSINNLWSSEEINRIINMWKNNNNLVIFWRCHFEPLEYESSKGIITNKWPFHNITITDFEDFKKLKNFYFDHFSNLIHYFGLDSELFNIVFEQIPHTENKEYEYYFSFFSPRIHKIEFLNKIIDNNLSCVTLVKMNKSFYDNQGNRLTDDQTLHFIKKNCKEYYNKNKIFRDFEEYRPYIKDNDYNLRNKETYTSDYLKIDFNKSYIDLNAETHCIFFIKPANTEKVYKSILAEKPFICIGAKKIYDELEKIGINNYAKIFNLEILQNSNEPFEQIPHIINFMQKNNGKIKGLFYELTEIRKQNRIKFLEHYRTVTKEIYEYINSYYATNVKS